MKVELKNQRILLTGASAGIGRAMARQLAERGVKSLILVARREALLQELQHELLAAYPAVQVHIYPCDLTVQTAIDHLLHFVSREVGAVDILINNAGMGDYGLFENSSWAKTEQILRLNIEGLTYLTHQLLGPMLALGRGAILNVSSVLGFFFMPGMSVYAATKHYVTAFTEGLRLELKGTGIVVSQLCPGPVSTEFAEVAGSSQLLAAAPAQFVLSAEQCAHEALDGLVRGQAIIIPGHLMRGVTLLGRLLPQPVLRWLLASSQGRFIRHAAHPTGSLQ